MACVRTLEPTQREDALRRLFALPERDLPQAVDLGIDYLNAGTGHELVVSREIREQHEALDALQAVRDELDLTDRAPTPAEFDITAKRLSLNWDRSRVIRAHGRWRRATHAVLGGRVQETPKQRAIRRAATADGRRPARGTHARRRELRRPDGVPDVGRYSRRASMRGRAACHRRHSTSRSTALARQRLQLGAAPLVWCSVGGAVGETGPRERPLWATVGRRPRRRYARPNASKTLP